MVLPEQFTLLAFLNVDLLALLSALAFTARMESCLELLLMPKAPVLKLLDALAIMLLVDLCQMDKLVLYTLSLLPAVEVLVVISVEPSLALTEYSLVPQTLPTLLVTCQLLALAPPL